MRILEPFRFLRRPVVLILCIKRVNPRDSGQVDVFPERLGTNSGAGPERGERFGVKGGEDTE